MAPLRHCIALLIFMTTTSCVLPQAVNFRLPTIIQPYEYQLELNLTAAAFTEASDEYYGMVKIWFSTTAATSTIQLHASHEYINITLVTVGNTDINQTQYNINPVTDILNIALPGVLPANGTFRLVITFIGRLSTTDMFGFYKSSYINPEGNITYLATTQFQPISARRAFPCFDEPAFKATFEVYLTFPIGYNALSNTPGSLHLNHSTSLTYRFNRTAVMSTYLLAFIISDFTCTQGESIGAVPYRICSRNETAEERTWAVEVGPQVLERLNNLTEYHYGNSKEKLDQVAIPDFAAGAMENWGLVTYREINLLFHPRHSSNQNKQTIVNIISHEFAHFWFGNLVTCNWWSELFLNEGFANYYQYHTTHEVLGQWQLDLQYVVNILQPILINDALENALPLQSNVSTPAEIMAKFGAITYSKGGSIIRMVEHFIGSANFRTGLRNYVHTFNYSTVIPEDLWSILNTVINNATTILPASNLGIVMQNWVRNPGYPLLTVCLENNHLIITQERFLLSGNDTVSQWFVPISFTTSVDANKFNSTLPNVWLPPNTNLTVNLTTNNSVWVIVNNQQTGYYRVNYDACLWNNIRDALRKEDFDGITEINRAQIVDDVFNLARARKFQYSRVFDIIEFITNDTSYFTWVPALNGFNFLLTRVGINSYLGGNISAHVLELMEKFYDSIDFAIHDLEDQIYTHSQVLALQNACRLGNERCISYSRLLFSAYRYSGTPPFRNLRGTIYCNTLRYSDDPSDWEFLWNEYLNASLAAEEATIRTALGCTTNVTILQRYLQLSINETSGIRDQDRFAVFQAVFNGNPIGVNISLQFLRENYQRIFETYTSMNAIPNLINGLAGLFTTQDQINQLREFIEGGALPAEFLPTATTAIETAEANLAWLQYFEDDLEEFYRDSAIGIGVNTIVMVLFVLICRVFAN